MMDSSNSTVSLLGFVSSKRRLQRPSLSAATPKFRQIDLACPICRYPLGSGGNRVCTRPPFLPALTSSATRARMKSKEGVGSRSDIFINEKREILTLDRSDIPLLSALPNNSRYAIATRQF